MDLLTVRPAPSKREEAPVLVRRRRWLRPAIALLLLGLFGLVAWPLLRDGSTVQHADAAPVSGGVASVATGDIAVVLTGLGAVTPLATVTVKTQINGQLLLANTDIPLDGGLRLWHVATWDKVSRRKLSAKSAHLFGAICPARGVGVAILMPAVNTDAMNEHLAEISRRVRPDTHAVILCDQAGWHQTSGTPQVPNNISLLSLPPYSPDLNPMRGQEDAALHDVRSRVLR